MMREFLFRLKWTAIFIFFVCVFTAVTIGLTAMVEHVHFHPSHLVIRIIQYVLTIGAILFILYAVVHLLQMLWMWVQWQFIDPFRRKKS